MYCFLNQFSFEYHKSGITDEIIKYTLEDLASLLHALAEKDINLIFNLNFSNVKINGIELKFHILKKLEQKSRIYLLKKIDSGKPFCSNTYDEYDTDEKIVLECKEINENINILETFLACALYLKAPVITADNFCSKGHYFNPEIEINCNEKEKRKLDNYKLSEYSLYIEKLNAERCQNINTWEEYFTSINEIYEKVKITDECKKNFEVYAFDSIQGNCIRNEVLRFETFLKDNKTQTIPNLNFKDLAKNINEESDTKKRKKKAQLTSKDINNNSMVMSWHTRVNGDFRLYFYFDDDLVYFTMYCKKIPDP